MHFDFGDGSRIDTECGACHVRSLRIRQDFTIGCIIQRVYISGLYRGISVCDFDESWKGGFNLSWDTFQ